jgi:hypothetical protein
MTISEKYICKQCWLLSAEKLSVCGQCKDVYYCSRECQQTDWNEGGHRAICNSIKRDKEIKSYMNAMNAKIEILSSRVDELTEANTDLLQRVYELEGRDNSEEEAEEQEDYIQEISRLAYRETEPEYAPVEENSGYENGGCYGCELMMNGYTGTIYPNHHSCMRTTN